MANIFIILVLCVVVKAECESDPKYIAPANSSLPELETLACESDSYTQRLALIDAARCGPPKEVFVPFKSVSYEEIYPRGVWVKRCVGFCDHEGPDSNCTANDTVTLQISVKVYSVKTNKERCSSYPVEEHVTCLCCDRKPSDCIAPKVYFRQSCTCDCGNVEDHKYCQDRGPKYHEWHADKCICLEKPAV